MKKIFFFSMFYSILVEEPDSVLLKKEGKQNAPKILSFPKELELHFFSISIPEFLFLCVSTPFHFSRSQIKKKKEMDKFLFLGTHTRKRIMVTPPLTTSFSFINFIVIEIQVLPRQNL